MALYDTNKNLIAGSRKTNIYRCNSFAEYEALPAAEKAKYDYVATPDDADTIIEYSLADFRKGDAYVENPYNWIHLVRCGKVICFTACLYINTDGTDKNILLDLPKPKNLQYCIATEANAANTIYKFSVTTNGEMATNWGSQWPTQRQFVLTGSYITID